MSDIYVGVNNSPKKIKAAWVGVNNVPKKIKNGWIGTADGAKLFFTTFSPPRVLSITHLGVLTWSEAEDAVSYVAEKYDGTKWYASAPTTSLSYTYNSFGTNITKVRVYARDENGTKRTSDDYDITWVKHTFNANGGSCSTSYYDRISGETVGELPVPTRSGYSFDYWTAGSTSGSRVYPTSAYSVNMTFYAHWSSSVVYYTVTLDANGGTLSSGTPSSQSVESGTTISLSSYSASKSSTTSNGYKYTYTFKGWYTARSGGAKITKITITSDEKFYAQYTETSTLILKAPTNVKVSGKTVTWTAATGAVKYKVFKNGNAASTAEGTTYSGSYTTSTSYTFNSSANMYKVWVVAYDGYGNSMSSSVVYP